MSGKTVLTYFLLYNREKLQKTFTLSRKITWRIVVLAPIEHNFLPSGEHLEQLLLSAGFCLEPWQRIAKRNSSAISLQRLCLSFIAFFREFQQNSRIATIIASAKPQRRTTKTPPIFWTLKGWAFESLLLSWKIVLDQQTNITKCNWCWEYLNWYRISILHWLHPCCIPLIGCYLCVYEKGAINYLPI